MEETSLSRPAFYQYYNDVHDLAKTLLSEIEAAMQLKANRWITGQGEPVSALHEALAGVISSCLEHGPVIRAIAEAAPMDARLEKEWGAFMRRWDDAVEARIRAQQQEGVITKPLDSRQTAKALNSLDAAFLIGEFGRRPQGDPVIALETLHEIWIGTLYGQSPRQIHGSRESGS